MFQLANNGYNMSHKKQVLKRDIRQRSDGVYELWTRLSAQSCGYAPRVVKDNAGRNLKCKRTGEPYYIIDSPVDVIVYVSKDLRSVIAAKKYMEVTDEWRD